MYIYIYIYTHIYKYWIIITSSYCLTIRVNEKTKSCEIRLQKLWEYKSKANKSKE